MTSNLSDQWLVHGCKTLRTKKSIKNIIMSWSICINTFNATVGTGHVVDNEYIKSNCKDSLEKSYITGIEIYLFLLRRTLI